MVLRYVEDTLEHNRKFDAMDIVSQEPSREGRLKYWTNELCEKRPQTFDFVVTVLAPSVHSLTLANSVVARRRWYSSLRQLALPNHCTSGSLLFLGLSGLPYKIRLRWL